MNPYPKNKPPLITTAASAALRCTALLAIIVLTPSPARAVTPKTGAIYFNGWGETHHETTVNNAVLVKSYPERAPTWGYYSNSVSYMEQEIDAAVNIGGLKFFAFLYYPALDSQPDGNYYTNPRNACFNNYFNAANRYSIEWCIYFANHSPYQPTVAYWKQVIDSLFTRGYFANSRYLKVDGKPVVIVFDPVNFTSEVRTYLRTKMTGIGMPGCHIIARGTAGGSGWDGHTEYNIQAGTGERTQVQLRADNITFLNTGTTTDPVIAFAENNWDNRAWVNSPARYYVGRSAPEFEANVTSVKNWMNTPSNAGKFLSDLMLINAWNENGEGGYLLPSVSEQFDHLKALKKAISGTSYTLISPPYPFTVGVRKEAESLGKGTTYITEANPPASGGVLMKMNTVNEQGALWGTFEGTDGTYAVDIRYYDENDGNSLAELYVGGRLIGSWDFSADTNALATKTFTNVSIKNRDVIKVISYAIAGEYARIDYITIR